MSNTHRTKKHLYLPHGRNNWCTFLYREQMIISKYRTQWTKGICLIWSRADISLPSCLAAVIINLAPKAITEPKSRGTSFVTTLWLCPGVLHSFSCFYANALVALRALIRIQFSLQAFVFFCRLPSAEAAGNIVRGRGFEGVSLCI